MAALVDRKKFEFRKLLCRISEELQDSESVSKLKYLCYDIHGAKEADSALTLFNTLIEQSKSYPSLAVL